ncbi:MAG: DUF4327 family protein [Cyanobacteria bacterium J083]|nr:MAG: DUF4327 family protein [Cyanobacteria bacterium J083]
MVTKVDCEIDEIKKVDYAIDKIKKVAYSMDEIREEARYLVEKGVITRHQPIYAMCEFIPPRDWISVECELERNDYTFRDHICDLLCQEEWDED